MMEEFPKELHDFYNEIHDENPDCSECRSSCCFQSGFAVRKNVGQIYQIYQKDGLIRKDYSFQSGLSYDDFVNRYFDVVRRVKLNLTIYFPRHLAGDNSVISIPFENDGDFYNIRDAVLKDRDVESRGCIFLERSLICGDQISAKCILHDVQIHDSLYAKPIDCIFLACTQSMKVKQLDIDQERRYFELIAKHYHD
jgi:hypothetical protein